jgi:hypothetical protein
LKIIPTSIEFVCLGQVYPYTINLLVDTVGKTLRFHFSYAAENTNVPKAAIKFDVVTTYKREKILFNKLASTEDQLLEEIGKCVAEFILTFSHPILENLNEA